MCSKLGSYADFTVWTWQDRRTNLGDEGMVDGAEYPKIRTHLIHLIAFRHFWLIFASHHCATLHNFWPPLGMTVCCFLFFPNTEHINTHANSIKESATRLSLHYFRRETCAFVHLTGSTEPITTARCCSLSSCRQNVHLVVFARHAPGAASRSAKQTERRRRFPRPRRGEWTAAFWIESHLGGRFP